MGAPAQRRTPITVLVAAAGYGKTAALRRDRVPGTVRLTAAEVLAGADGLDRAVRLCVDDLDRLDPHDQHTVLRRLGGLRPAAGTLVASRTPLPPAARPWLPGPLDERGPDHLALTPYAVARVLRDDHDVRDPEAALRVHELTAGWPALVHQVAGELARHPHQDPLTSLTRPGSATADWVHRQVLAPLGEPWPSLLGQAAGFGCCTPGLLQVLARGAGLDPDPARLRDLVDDLRAVGVLVPGPALDGQGPLRLVPVVAGVLAAAGGGHPTAEVAREAAAALEADGCHAAAMDAYAAHGAQDAVDRLLATHGAALVRAGDARAVADALAGSPAPGADVRRVHARALAAIGDPVAAQRVLRPLTEPTGPLSAGVATDVAAVHYVRGELAESLAALDRAEPAGSTPAEEAGWRSCRAHVLTVLGRPDEAAREARAGLRAAEAQEDAAVLATAHLAVATATGGARRSVHQCEALRAAREAGDAITTARILVNQAYLLLASARFAEAVPVAREAVRVSEYACRSGRRSAALHNLAEALVRTGAHEEARWLLERAVAAARRLGPERCATGLLGLADVERQLGHLEQARTQYAEVVALARASDERQVLVPALAGLAGVVAVSDPGQAVELATEGLGLATPFVLPFALLGLGRATLAAGDAPGAAAHAEQAVVAARDDDALDLVAEALELLAACRADPARARADYAEALAIWSAGGALPAAHRVEVLLARLPGADAAARSRGRAAARGLRRLGVETLDGRPVTDEPTAAAVRVAVLGGFAVEVDGAPVDHRAWRSRQARTLVKVLAAHRGRPVTRSALCELLWPDDDPARTGHRLSVLLATVRGVLDPARSWPVDRHLVADRYGVRLDLAHVDLDAALLLDDAEHAAQLLADGEEALAEEVLADVDGRYVGDAFADEPYEAWADPLREEVRAAWLRSVRRLVGLRRSRGRGGDTQRLLARMLAVDPYDESAHRLLVGTLTRTGRHGEARRAFARWTLAMEEIEAPQPDPALLHVAL